jgi:hypothetical protein
MCLDEAVDSVGGSEANGTFPFARNSVVGETRLSVSHCKSKGSKVANSTTGHILRQAGNLFGDIFNYSKPPEETRGTEG